jgi:hypothetical protein
MFDEAMRLSREWRDSQCEECDNNAIILTRNLSDFENLPGAQMEDWTQ